MTTKPRVLVLADVSGWAWDRKGQQYVTHLSDEFDVHLAYMTRPEYGRLDVSTFDLVHCFEVSQIDRLPESIRERRHSAPRIVAGLTAHVWRTWGADRMHAWAESCDALHGNSYLLVDELRQFHARVYYTPNGVDADFWSPEPGFVDMPDIDTRLVACHVGKPNPRKGSAMIVEACRRRDIPLLLCQRSSQIALPPEAIRQLYRASHVQITMSDMDGTPNPMLEAAACGSALISTRIGNMPDLIRHGVNGYLVDRSADALVAALSSLTPARAVAMGRSAREDILHFWTWTRTAEYVRALWRAVLGGR